MKHIVIPLFTFTFGLHLASAAVPLSWTVETTRAQPATFEAYQGETLAFEAALQSRGKPLEAPSNYSFFWQTNGMGSTYWESPCTGGAGVPPAQTNVLFATWLPSMDVGAKVYNCFIGAPSNIYHAAFQLRLRPSPGATPNVLPLPVPVIDFAKVRVLNPPWPTTAGTDTNAVRDIIHATVDGAARPLPKYLHIYDADDSYPDAAAEYYDQRQGGGAVPAPQCSAVRSGGYLCRNFDFPFDERSEFVVRMSASTKRFASVGVAQVGTNLTEAIVTSGKPSRCYKWLPGATVDGINENGVVAEINVVDTPVAGWHTNATDKAIHPLAAVRWVLDNATNAQSAAQYIAANIRFPVGWTQNFHYMIADTEKTYIVENGMATDGDEYHEPDEPVTMTNFQLSKFPWGGMGMERFGLLLGGANITNAWYTRAYHRSTNPPWVSDLADVLDYTNAIFDAWAAHPKEYFRNQLNGGQPWWQSVHTSVYDITNRTLRVAVQEVDDWYTFAVPATVPKIDAYTKAETDAKLAEKVGTNDFIKATNDLASSVSRLESSKIPYDEWGGISMHEYNFKENGVDRGALTTGGVVIKDEDGYPKANVSWPDGDGKFALDSDVAAAKSAADAADAKADAADAKADAADAKADAAQAHSEATRVIVATWESFLDGSNVVFSITNYLSGTYSLDHAKFQIKELRPGDSEYTIVYDSRTEITNHTEAAKSVMFGVINSTAAELRTEIAGKGDKAWGRRSSTGQEVPISNTVWVTEQNLRIAGGMEYERVAVGEGAIYVLASKGQTPYMQGDEGSLMLKDDGGTNYFGMARSDSYTIGCNTDGIRVENKIVYLDFLVTMSNHPVIWYTPTLEGDVVWEQLNLPDGSAVPGASHIVTWDESPRLGAQECFINCPEPKGFFRATIEVAGDCRFRTNMPAEVPSFFCSDDPTKKVKIIWNGGSPKLVEAN